MGRTYNDSMFIETFEHEYTWLNGFKRNVRRFGTRPAVIDPEQRRTLSYRELNAEANALANALQQDGIRKDDIVMGAIRNSPAFTFAYTGPRKIGAIILAVNFNLASGEMALLIDHNRPRIVLYSANILSVILEAEKLCKWRPQRFVMVDNIEKLAVPKHHTLYEDYVRGASKEEPAIDFRPHIYDEVVRMCTSGTTALPKCVQLNDINEVLSAHDVIMHYPMTSRDVTLNMTPWFHRGGAHSGGPCPTFYVGGAVVVMRSFKPQNALDWVARYGVTFLMGAPANLEVLNQLQERNKRDLSSLRGIVTMGAPLSKAACVKYMKNLSPNIFNGYGTTETFWNSFLRPYNLPEGAGSVGASCTDDEVRVVKIYDDRKADPDDLVEADDATEGEIIIKSPAKTTYSYYKNEQVTAEKFSKGWMYTGDTGTWTTEGIVTVRGRKDDMMVVSGENIYPTQIEEAVLENPKVKDCIVTCVPDMLRGQAVAAYVIAADESLTVAELSDFCSKSKMLSKYKRPRYFAIVTSLPYTATGKKMHYALKQRAKDDLKTGVLQKSSKVRQLLESVKELPQKLFSKGDKAEAGEEPSKVEEAKAGGPADPATSKTNPAKEAKPTGKRGKA